MESWPDWVKQIVQLSKLEATTRPAVKKLLASYEADIDVAKPTCTGLCQECIMKYLVFVRPMHLQTANLYMYIFLVL